MPAPAQLSKSAQAPAAWPKPPLSPPQPHSACSLCPGPPSDTTLPVHSLLPGAHTSPPPLLPRGCTGSSPVSAGTALPCPRCATYTGQGADGSPVPSPGPRGAPRGGLNQRLLPAWTRVGVGGSPPEAQLGRGCTYAAHGLGAARGTQRTHWKQSWGTRWPEGGEETPTRRPPTPARAGRPRQGLTALHYPADLAGINLTIYTHANQL